MRGGVGGPAGFGEGVPGRVSGKWGNCSERSLTAGVWGSWGGEHLRGTPGNGGCPGRGLRGSLGPRGVPGAGLGVVQPLSCRTDQGHSTWDKYHLAFICSLWARPPGEGRAEAAGLLLWGPRGVPTAQGAVSPGPSPPRRGRVRGLHPPARAVGNSWGAPRGPGEGSLSSPGTLLHTQSQPFGASLCFYPQVIPALRAQQPGWG